MPLYKLFRSYSGVKKEGCLYSLDWTTGLDYWTDVFANKNYFMPCELNPVVQ